MLRFELSLVGLLTLLHLLLFALALLIGNRLLTPLLAFSGQGYAASVDVYLLDMPRRLTANATRSPDNDYRWQLADDQPQMVVVVTLAENPSRRALRLLDWSSHQVRTLPLDQLYLVSINDIDWHGQTILYAAMFYEQNRVFNYDILAQQTRDTIRAFDETIPSIALSPDGRWLVYSTLTHALETDFYATPADCRADCPSYRMTSQSGNEEQIIWSPDGKQIAFISTVAATHIYSLLSDCLYDAEQEDGCQDQNARRFDTGDVVPEGRPFVWSADGRMFLFRGVQAGQEGLYRMPSDCFADPAGCAPELIYDLSALPYLGKR